MDLNELLTKLGIADEKKTAAEKTIKEYLNGSYVTKSRFNEVNEEKNTAKTTIAERDKQLEQLKNAKGDVEGLKAKIKELQETNTADKKAADEKFKAMQLSNAIKLAITDKAQDVDIVSGLIDRKKLILGEDGKVTGLDEQVKALMKDKAFLFKTEDKKPPKYDPNGGGGDPIKNPFAKETLNMTQQGKLLRENPEQAKAMAAAAGVELNI